jgi:hypothetical protein
MNSLEVETEKRPPPCRLCGGSTMLSFTHRILGQAVLLPDSRLIASALPNAMS